MCEQAVYRFGILFVLSFCALLGRSVHGQDERPGDFPLWRARGLHDALSDPDMSIRRAAVRKLGKDRRNFGPEVIESLKDVVPQIAELLNDRNPDIRGTAAYALGIMGERAKDFAPQIAELLKDDYWAVKIPATKALGMMGEHAKDLAPQIAELLNDEEEGVRIAALGALFELGDHAITAIPQIADHEEWPTLFSYIYLKKAMAKDREFPKVFAQPIVKLLKDDDELIRSNAAFALGMMGDHGKNFAPQIAELLKDDDWGSRSSAAYALGMMREHAKDFAPQIAELFEDQDPWVRSSAKNFFRTLGPWDAKTLVMLLSIENPTGKNSAQRLALAYEFCGAATVKDCDTTMSELVFLLGRRPNISTKVTDLERFSPHTKAADYVDLLTALQVAWTCSQDGKNEPVRDMIANRVNEVANSVAWNPDELPILKEWINLLQKDYPNVADSIDSIITGGKRQVAQR